MPSEADLFSVRLAGELESITPRPGGWERVRQDIGPARASQSGWARHAAALMAAALLAAATYVAAGRQAPATPGPAPVMTACGILFAIAAPMSLADVRRRAHFPVLTAAGLTPSGVNLLTTSSRDPRCAAQVRLDYPNAVVWERPASPAAGNSIAVESAGAGGTTVAAVHWARGGTAGDVVFRTPVSRLEALDVAGRLA
jgi:hypothetical protein